MQGTTGRRAAARAIIGGRLAALVVVIGAALALTAGASANLDASFTPRAAATASVAGDCNGNGVPDTSEGAWANRDDDGDAICNGVDPCPAEASPATCELQAITVPWRPSAPAVPHRTYSGATTTLKGIARYGGNQFMWDFGDGSAPMAWTAIANPYNLGVRHAFVGAVGQTFVATLSVRNSANPAVVATAAYPLEIGEGAGAVAGLSASGLETRRQMAIDEGLWYLHLSETRSQYADGAPGYRQPFGSWGASITTCMAVDALERHGSVPGAPHTDPYVEDVSRGLANVLTFFSSAPITAQLHGNPDTNGNAAGLLASGSPESLTTARCAMALADSGSGAALAPAGGSQVYGRSYADVVQDVADWFSFGQIDSGSSRGGWGYTANSSTATSEMEPSVILALGSAERHFGATVPAFVRAELPFFLSVVRTLQKSTNNGGAGDFSANDALTSVRFTAGALIADAFLGRSAAFPDTQASEGYLYRHWLTNDGVWLVNLGDSDAMYGVMRALTGFAPAIDVVEDYDYNAGRQTANGFTWFYTQAGSPNQGIASNLIQRQAADGGWTDSTGTQGGYTSGREIATAMDVAILQAGAPASAPPVNQPPVASIANPGRTVSGPVPKTVTFDASGSSDPDGDALTYSWTFDAPGGASSGASTPQLTLTYTSYGTFQAHVTVSDGLHQATADATVTVVDPTPASPTGVTATASPGSITVAWTPSGGATSYAVSRSTDGVSYAALATVSSPSYTDTSVSPGQAYSYEVTAVSTGGTSAPSAPASAIVPLAAPAGVTAVPSGAAVTVGWNASPGATSYTVRRSPDGVLFATLGTTPSTSFTDAAVSPGQAFVYVVVAHSAAASSDPSDPVSVTIPLPAPSLTAPLDGQSVVGSAVAVAGAAAPGATVTILAGGTSVATFTAGVDGAYGGQVTLSYGVRTLAAAQRLGAVESPPSAPVTIAVVPAAPSIAAPAAVVGTSVEVTGLAEPGASVEVLDGFASVASVVADSAGAYQGTVVLHYGPNELRARQTAGGETSALSAPATVHAVPAAPTLASTAAGQPAVGSPVPVSGVGVPGADVTVLDGGAPVAVLQVGAGGTYAGSVPLAGGTHTLTARQAIAGETSAASPPVTVSVDATPPVVTYTGNAGTYLVGETVAIRCTATDAGSGLASSTCADITGPAYTFGAGPHTFSARATDNAGNTATATVTFTVVVDTAGICTLTRQFVQGSAKYRALPAAAKGAADGLANGACKKLEAITLKGNAAARAAHVNAYDAGLTGLVSAGWLTAAQAATLRSLADRL